MIETPVCPECLERMEVSHHYWHGGRGNAIRSVAIELRQKTVHIVVIVVNDLRVGLYLFQQPLVKGKIILQL